MQALHGIGADCRASPFRGLVARIFSGTGRVNVGQGAVMTIQGLGASPSPALGGLIAERRGYPVTFMILDAFSIGSLLLWLVFAQMLRLACAAPPKRRADDRRVST